MQASKQIISKSNIEKEIYNTFELFKKQKKIIIADYLKKFDTTIFEQKKYRKINFSYESLIKRDFYSLFDKWLLEQIQHLPDERKDKILAEAKKYFSNVEGRSRK